jgi:hypothetical protein
MRPRDVGFAIRQRRPVKGIGFKQQRSATLVGCRSSGSFVIQEADMEAIQSNTGPSAVEYVLIALSVTLLLSVYLVGGPAIPRQYEAPNTCRINAQPEYAPPRG